MSEPPENAAEEKPLEVVLRWENNGTMDVDNGNKYGDNDDDEKRVTLTCTPARYSRDGGERVVVMADVTEAAEKLEEDTDR